MTHEHNGKWKPVELGEIIDIFDSIRVPLNSQQRAERKGKYPYYGASGVIDSIDDYLFDGEYVLVAEDGENLNSRKLPVAFMARGQFWVNNHAHIIKGKKCVADDRFLIAWFAQADIKGYITGAAQPKLSQANLKRIALTTPPYPIQRKIAGVLSAYDDLIENNTRRIVILEAMAQAIYREWFVEFRFPGHEKVKLVNSSLGKIPAGWKAQLFSDLLESMRGGDWGSEQPNEEEDQGVVVVRGTDFDEVAYGGTLRVPLRHITASSVKTRQLRDGDVILENSVNAKSRCIGTPLLVDHRTLTRLQQPAIAASFCKVFRFHDPSLAPVAYWHLRHLRQTKRMEYYQNTAANGIGNFQATRFADEEALLLPNDSAIRSVLVTHLSDACIAISNMASRIANLRRTRDLLLPKLITGQLDLEDLDIDTGEAVTE